MVDGKRGYKISVSGQYYAGAGREKMLKVFSNEVFYIPETVEIVNGQKYVYSKDLKDPSGRRQVKKAVPNKQTVNGLKAALHVIRRRLLDARLSEKFPDYTGVRTCYIVNQAPCFIPASEIIDLKRPIAEMSLAELNMICAAESLITVPKMFASLSDARAAVAGELQAKTLARRPLRAEQESYPADEPTETATDGVLESSGEVTSDDGVPVDDEDPAANLI